MTVTIVGDPTWWPHRFDPARGQLHFIRATRDDHRKAVFLTDEYLANAANPRPVGLAEAAQSSTRAPLHFVFHSAYCCSTLLARAFDLPGTSMGLKEPQILNDLQGWRVRGAKPQEVAVAMDGSLAALARPFEEGEATIVKPSNLVNGLAGLMLHLRPDAKAIFLYAPLKEFLGSIARKGMWGRHWVRDLMVKQLREGLINLGLEGEDYLRLTDLQAAAVGWLAQHALFLQVVEKFGPDRVRTLSSADLMASPADAMGALVRHFGMTLSDAQMTGLLEGPVFQKHSKGDEAFDAEARDAERRRGELLFADEIEKVHTWAEAVARNAGVTLDLPAALV